MLRVPARLLIGLGLGLAALVALRDRRPRRRERRSAPAPSPAPRTTAVDAKLAERDAPSPRGGGERLGLVLGLGVLLLAGVAGDVVLRGRERTPSTTWVVPGGDPERGRAAILRRGCGSCHVIPGIRTARGRVGPQLVDFVNQSYVAGVLANEPDNLVRWLRRPREVNPLTAMPDLGLGEAEARDMAAYLYDNP